MAETLVELVAKIKTDSIELEKGLTDAERKTEASSKKMSESLQKVGMAMTASGAAITAALGLMGKAAIDEDINMKRLATTIENSGTAYDSVKESLEAVIATISRKTGVADNEQRDILNRLILVTNDYNKALKLLPTTLDLAAAGSMDATTAATYLGKAYLELEDGAKEVSVRFGQASLQFKNIEDIQNRVAGAAENLANPLNVLKATMGNVAEVVGTFLIPHIKTAVNWIVNIAEKIQVWIKENPDLAKTITIITGAIGGILTVIGAWILLMPKLRVAWLAFNTVFTASPIGLIITAIGLLIAAGIALWQNWDTVSEFIKKAWTNIKIFFLTGIEKILNGLAKFTSWIPGIGDKISELHDKIAGMLDAEQVKKDASEIESRAKELTKTIKAELDRQKNDALTILNEKKALTKDEYDDSIRKAKEVSKLRGQSLKDELDKAKDIHDEKIALLNEEYNLKIKTLNAEADAQIQSLQSQVDAIDEQTRQEDLVLTRQEEQKRLNELTQAVLSAQTAEEVAEAKTKYFEYATQVERNELLRSRDEEKRVLRERIDEIKTEAKTKEDTLKEEFDVKKTYLEKEYNAFADNQQKIIDGLDEALIKELGRLETQYNTTIETLGKEEIAIRESFDTRLTEASLYQTALEATLKDIKQTVTTTYVSTGTRLGGHEINEFANGGIVPGIIGQPQLAIVHGGETVIPTNQSMGNVTINFTQPVFFDREDQMNIFVDKISKTLDRKYRLNGRL